MNPNSLIGCCLYDKISNRHVAFTFVNSKEEYVRSIVESAILQYKNLNDLTPKIVCEYDVISGKVVPRDDIFSFDCYKMPASKADALAPLGVDFAKEALEFEQWKKERNEKLEQSNKE